MLNRVAIMKFVPLASLILFSDVQSSVSLGVPKFVVLLIIFAGWF
jgi:hypothetical protein